MTMRPSTPAAIAIAVVTAILVAIYLARHRRHPPDVYVPQAAWLRAGIYFCACYLVAIAWRTESPPVFDALLSNPIATPKQIADPAWWAFVVGLTALVTVAYWGIWARYTLRFDRRLDLIPQIVFGLFWGPASGLLFLSFYHVAQAVGRTWAPWQVWLLAYAAIGLWQWLWQDYGWDVYISPEHDSPWSIKIKVIATHIPNITACLIFFALYKNYALFVALQTWALVGASVAMRMPAPWSREVTPPATRSAGLLGLTRASGYVSVDPENDPYLRAAHLPRQVPGHPQTLCYTQPHWSQIQKNFGSHRARLAPSSHNATRSCQSGFDHALCRCAYMISWGNDGA
jgi:hypothetical protein